MLHKQYDKVESENNSNINQSNVYLTNTFSPVHYNQTNKKFQCAYNYNQIKKRIVPKPTINKHFTSRSVSKTDLTSNTHKSKFSSFLTNNNSNNQFFNLTSFRFIDSNNTHNNTTTKFPSLSLRTKQSTSKAYLPIQKHKEGMNWEPHCPRSISTTSIVPNQGSFVSQSQKFDYDNYSTNLYKRVRVLKCFDHVTLNDELIRTDKKKICLYRKRRYLQDYGLGTIKIIYQINQMMIVIEPFSSFTPNIYLLIIPEEDNLSLLETEFPSFDRLILRLRYEDDTFIINKKIQQFKYTTQAIDKKKYYLSCIEKDLNIE